MSLSAHGLDSIRNTHPELYTALKSTVDAVNKVAQTTGVGSNNVVQAPTNRGQLSVQAANGVFDVAIMDPSPARGEHYFLEWDNNPDFTSAKTVPLGPTRNWRGFLGSGNTYWRYYKQYLGSNVSNHILYGGSKPEAVGGGGDMAGPIPQASQGSGTSKVPGHGFGAIGK